MEKAKIGNGDSSLNSRYVIHQFDIIPHKESEGYVRKASTGLYAHYYRYTISFIILVRSFFAQ